MNKSQEMRELAKNGEYNHILNLIKDKASKGEYSLKVERMNGTTASNLKDEGFNIEVGYNDLTITW